jgi:TrmH family RNA methyltransferase
VTFDQLRETFDVLVGTTAISARSRLNVLRTQTRPDELAKLIHKAGKAKHFCILLGRESSGLNNSELQRCDLVVIIDTKTQYSTLNVSHALAILLYELSKMKQRKVENTKKRIYLASRKETELLLHYVDIIAAASNYDNHKLPLLRHAAKNILTKSSPNVKDVMLLVSLLRRSILAIDRSKRPHSIP